MLGTRAGLLQSVWLSVFHLPRAFGVVHADFTLLNLHEGLWLLFSMSVKSVATWSSQSYGTFSYGFRAQIAFSLNVLQGVACFSLSHTLL